MQIKTRASCIGGEEHAAVGVVGEVDDEVAALGRRYTAMQIFIADAHLVEFVGDEARHALPLAENDHLLVTVVEYRLEDAHRLSDLCVVA